MSKLQDQQSDNVTNSQVMTGWDHTSRSDVLWQNALSYIKAGCGQVWSVVLVTTPGCGGGCGQNFHKLLPFNSQRTMKLFPPLKIKYGLFMWKQKIKTTQ